MARLRSLVVLAAALAAAACTTADTGRGFRECDDGPDCRPTTTALTCAATGDRALEGEGDVTAWRFSDGGEVPGASGAVHAAPGRHGRVLALDYDFAGDALGRVGDYVAATRAIASPGPMAALTLWLVQPPGVRFAVRVTDVTGETVQYRLDRPLYARDPAAWFPQTIALGPSPEHWDGDGDGVIDWGAPGAAMSISLLALRDLDPARVGPAVYGADARGSLLADDLAWQPAAALDPTDDARFAPAEPSQLAFLAGLGVQIHYLDFVPLAESIAAFNDPRHVIRPSIDQLARARAYGFSWIRYDLTWAAVEAKPGVYDFADWDLLVGLLAQLDLGLVLILDYGNPLYADGATGDKAAPHTAAQRAAFAAYVRAAAAHFAGAPIPIRWEVWNEANIPTFWQPSPSATDYASLAAAAIPALRSAAPTAEISTTGTSGVDLRYLDDILAQGGAVGADAIGVHPYRGSPPETASGDLVALRDLVARRAPGAIVWDTEWGYSSSWGGPGDQPEQQARQARFAVRKMLTTRALGLPMSIFYDLSDDAAVDCPSGGTCHYVPHPDDPEQNFGLLRYDGSEKPAGQAVGALAAALAGRGLVGEWACAPAGVHGLRFVGDDTLLVLWADGSQPDATIVLTRAPTSATDLFGQQRAVGTTVTLREADGPLYLKF